MTISHRIIIIELFIFLILLSMGITGSSLGLIKQYGLVSTDEQKIAFSYRGIRSDEWSVGTLLSICQYNQEDKFPLKNTNLGAVGKHLAIAHDTGVPVREVSAIGKPATWGFHLFDLRRALAWYWLVPLFISLNGIWFLLNELWPQQKGINFLFGLALTYAPHSVAWSFWPSYQDGLACAFTASFIALLRSEQKTKNVILSILMGLFGSSLALTLYIPRIIPIVTLLLFVTIAVLYKENLWKNIISKWTYLAIALTIIVVVLGSWYINNSEAIQAMLSSTYPGQRRIYGGRFTLWDAIRGWLAPLTLAKNYGYSNVCELQSYLSYLVPIAGLLCLKKEKLRFQPVEIAILGFILFTMLYQYASFPEWLGKLSFWNRCSEARVDIGIDLAQCLFWAWIFANQQLFTETTKVRTALSIVIPVIFLILITIVTPAPILNAFKLKPHRFICAVALLFILIYVFLRHYKYFPATLAAFMLAITFTWHPICIAPTFVKADVSPCILQENVKHGGKVVVATGDHVRPNIVASTGIKVLNATSHYVDRSIYDIFYKDIDNGMFKKFNHMIITINETDVSKIYPSGDTNHLNISGMYFDFSKFPADYLIALSKDKTLQKNQSLNFLEERKGFSYYQIKHDNTD